jgi:hypothetical protein
MIADYSFFACGSMGGGLALLLLTVLALWIVSGLLFLVNLCLLFALRDGPLLRNASGLLLYTAAGLAAYHRINSASVPNPEVLLFTGAFGLPAIIIGHFIWLVRLVRRERRALRAESHPS